MNILMISNTFTPHVGGVARSIEGFAEEYRRRGHRVLVVAPVFEDQPEDEQDVIRIPAIQHFNGSDFSVVLPVPHFLASGIEEFAPDVVHSHHPFLLGATALRIAHLFQRPLVFTHHTMYEQYTHYVPGDSEALKRFVVDLATCYANLCERVIAPSESVAEVLFQRGVTTPMTVIPTGVRPERFAHGDGPSFRRKTGIPRDAFLVGHLGRLAPEKNLEFLAEAVAAFLAGEPQAHFLVAGRGPSEQSVRDIFARHGIGSRLHFAGILDGTGLAGCYRAMDVFAFASGSETQGMVLTEAMAAGVPVVALDAPGAREVVSDGLNGCLLESAATPALFRDALAWIARLTDEEKRRLMRGATITAADFSMTRCADKALALYEELRHSAFVGRRDEYKSWAAARRMIGTEWDLLKGIATAAEAALHPQQSDSDQHS